MTNIDEPVTKLRIKVVPGASRPGISGWLGDALKIRVVAPPEKGRANNEVVALLLDRLRLERDAVRIVSGHGSSRKLIEIHGLTSAEVERRVQDALG